jgi:acyl carrier protein
MNPPLDVIRQTILRQVSSGILPAYIAELDLAPETRLFDLGIDSLGKMTLIAELGSYFPQGLPRGWLDESATLGEIAAQMSSEPRKIARSRS